MVTEFAQVNALPGPKIKLPIGDWNGNRLPYDARFEMSRHVVSPLQRMCEIGLIFTYNFVDKRFKVMSDAGIGILVQGQTG